MEYSKKSIFKSFGRYVFRHLSKWGPHYYKVLFSPLSPFYWPQNAWPRITLTILSWIFTIVNHGFRNWLIVELTYRIFLLYDVTSRDMRKRTSAEYCGSSKGLHWLQNTWPWMTLSGHLTLHFHYYEQPFENWFYILTVELVYITWPAEMCGKRTMIRNLGSAGLWIFRRRYIVAAFVGTLTNKADISI